MDTSTLPTKNNLIRVKEKLKLSKQGHDLLEKKKFILTVEKNKYEKKKNELSNKIQNLIQDAKKAFINASIDIGIDELINIANGMKIDDNIDIKYKSIMGVEIPSVVYDEKDIEISYGLYSTTISVDIAVSKYYDIKRNIIKLAELEATIKRLEKNILKVQKRSNALKDIVIPEEEKLEKEIQDILEERDREEFTRLKVIKGK